MMGNVTVAISIDLGGTFIKGAVVDVQGNILTKASKETCSGQGREVVLNNIIGLIRELEGTADVQIVGIGIGSPGSIDTENGIIKGGIANVPELNGLALADELGKEFSYPIYVDNDATNAAKGEFYFGAGKGFDNILCLTLGTGIGAGIILNGEVYHGVSDYAGEIGHMTIVPEGRPCSCGKLGCIEAYSSGTAMVSRALAKKTQGVDSLLNDYEASKITPLLIEQLAEKGDEQCKEILYEAGRYLGIMLASVNNLLNLEKIIIGGGISAGGNLVFDPIIKYYNSYVLTEAGKQCNIVKAKLLNDAGAMGGAASVFMGNNLEK